MGSQTERYGSPWLTVSEASAYARCGAGVIEHLIRWGALKVHPGLGNSATSRRPSRLVNKRDIDALIESKVIEYPTAQAVGSTYEGAVAAMEAATAR